MPLVYRHRNTRQQGFRDFFKKPVFQQETSGFGYWTAEGAMSSAWTATTSDSVSIQTFAPQESGFSGE
jgi:hypothetical protein